MNGKKKIVVIIILLLLFNCTVAPTKAAENDKLSDQISVELDISEEDIIVNAKEGINYLLQRDEYGVFHQTIIPGPMENIPQPAITADGVLEWCILHVGFKDWTDDYSTLYLTVSSDEPLSYITGVFYVKSTSILHPKYYYNPSFSQELFSLNGAMVASRIIEEHVDCEGDESVRVGFLGAIVVTLTGDSGSFTENSVVVYKDDTD